MATRDELKRELLRLLREDEEFRLAVAGLVGLREILEELRGLRAKSLEHDKRFEALERKMIEHDKRFEAIERKLLEHDKRFEAIEKKLLEHDKRFEAIERKLLEHDKRFEAIEKKLLEHDEKFRAIMEEIRRLWEEVRELRKSQVRVEEAVRELASHITALGHRYGLFTEEALRESLKYLIEDLLREYRVNRWIYVDEEGFVFGYKSVIEVDVLIKDDEHILVEYKASVDRSDVAELYRIGRLYERATGVKPKLLIVSPALRKRARELAERLGVELRGVSIEE